MTVAGQALVLQETSTLLNFDKARLALEQASRIDEVKEIRDQAEALRLYCRQSEQSLVMQNHCAEIKLRAERKAGQFLADMPKHPPGPEKQDRLHDVTDPPRLEDIGVSKIQSHRWQQVASVPEGSFEDYVGSVKAQVQNGAYSELTTAGLLRRPDAALRSSDSNEWYTPLRYIDAAREILGTIDLDPASSLAANETVKGTTIHTTEDDGLTQRWYGNVWLNPPYGGLSAPFTAKLLEEFEAGHVTAAVLLVNANSTDTQWFQPLWNFTLCFTDHRINFVNPAGAKNGATHGSVFVYFGPDPHEFRRVFSPFGAVVAAGVAS